MRYKLLGKSGLRVSELSLGTMSFGEDVNKEKSKAIFEAYANSGGNFLDTANFYSNGTSERLVGEFIASERDHFVIGTKYTLYNKRSCPNASGNHRKNMVHSLEQSLIRLNIEYIDLYWLHAWDFMTPIDEIMRAFDDMIRAGKILYIGISNTPAWIVAQGNTIAELRGWSPFVGMQIRYNLLDRSSERELLPMAQAFDIGMVIWSPLSNGFLNGKYQHRVPVTRFNKILPTIRRYKEVVAEVNCIAKSKGRSSAQVALNWVRQQSDLIIPILGARTLLQIQDSMSCLEFVLDTKELKRLSKVSKIELGFPHNHLLREFSRDTVYGGTYSLIDQKR